MRKKYACNAPTCVSNRSGHTAQQFPHFKKNKQPKKVTFHRKNILSKTKETKPNFVQIQKQNKKTNNKHK